MPAVPATPPGDESPGIGFFDRFLTIWVILCMGLGLLIGRFLPAIPDWLGKLQYSEVSIPIAVLIWVMIYPMMLKVDFASIKNVGRNPKGLFLTWAVNWLVKPFTMFALTGLFFYVVFAQWIAHDTTTFVSPDTGADLNPGTTTVVDRLVRFLRRAHRRHNQCRDRRYC